MPGVDIAGLGQFGVFRRPTPYDPVKILGRIILLQIVYTILLSLLTWSMPVRGRIIREVFDPSAFLSPQAPLTMVLYASGSLLIALFMGFLQGPIVAKSRQCLDYGATMYGVHLFICVILGGVTLVLLNPALLVLIVVQCAITVQVGRFQCQQAELLPIPLGSATSPMLVGEGGGGLSKFINGSIGRVRSFLPMFTGFLARLLRMGSSGSSSGHDTMVPLNSASTIRNAHSSLPVTPKKV